MSRTPLPLASIRMYRHTLIMRKNKNLLKKLNRGNCACYQYTSLRTTQGLWMARRNHPLPSVLHVPFCNFIFKGGLEASCSLQVVWHHPRHLLTVCCRRGLAEGSFLLPSQPCTRKVFCQTERSTGICDLCFLLNCEC